MSYCLRCKHCAGGVAFYKLGEIVREWHHRLCPRRAAGGGDT